MATLTAVNKGLIQNGWDKRHNNAVTAPGLREAILPIIKAWARYANAHKQLNETPIGEDGYCGPYFEEIAHGINGLLSADIGRLDGGTLNRFILETLEENGCDPNEA